MDKKELDSVLAVDSCLNFSEAALQLSFSQSAVSKHVSVVEKELGVELFKRKTRAGVSRTSFGDALMPEIRACADAYDRLFSHASALHKENNDYLRVSCHAVMGTLGEDELISDFCAAHPEIRVDQIMDKFGITPSAPNIDGVDLDFSLFSPDELRALAGNSALGVLPIMECRPQILLPRSHAAAQGSSVSLQSLRDETFLFRSIPSESNGSISGKLLQLFVSACGTEGFAPNIHFVNVRPATVINMVSANQGILLLMYSQHTILPDNTIPLPMEKDYYSLILTAYYNKKNRSPTLRTFLKFLQERSTYSL